MHTQQINAVSDFGEIQEVLSLELLGISAKDGNEAALVVSSNSTNDTKERSAYAVFDESYKHQEDSKVWINAFIDNARTKLRDKYNVAELQRIWVSKDIIKNLYERHGKQNAHDLDKNEVKLRNIKMFHDANIMGASDIHINSNPDSSSVKFRVNGELQRYETERNQDELFDQVAVMYSSMAADSGSIEGDQFNEKEQRDAVIYVEVEGMRLGGRIATHPTTRDDKDFYMVIRCLGDQNSYADKIPFEKLGFIFDQKQKIIDAIHAKGMVLTIGETNSGKSVTQQNYLMELRDSHQNKMAIYSMENPIERRIRGVIQFNIVETGAVEKGASQKIAEGLLRFFMRSDPNIIAVSEIRDKMSVDAAIQLGLSGHKVFSTLHVESPFDCYERMIGLGANPSILGSAKNIAAIVSQNLLQRLCPSCSLSIDDLDHLDQDQLEAVEQLCEIGLSHKLENIRFRNYHSHNTCKDPNCKNGLTNRQLVAEVLRMDDALIQLLAENKKEEALIEWLKAGNLTKTDCAIHYITKGIVDPQNALRELKEDLGLKATYSLRQKFNIHHPRHIYG